MSGAFWIDESSHAVVRALIRPARPFDFEQDVSDEDGKDIPGFVKPIKIEIRYITIDYGLWTGRWWLRGRRVRGIRTLSLLVGR